MHIHHQDRSDINTKQGEQMMFNSVTYLALSGYIVRFNSSKQFSLSDVYYELYYELKPEIEFISLKTCMLCFGIINNRTYIVKCKHNHMFHLTCSINYAYKCHDYISCNYNYMSSDLIRYCPVCRDPYMLKQENIYKTRIIDNNDSVMKL